MSKQYGYCRISTGRQNIDRQVRNIQSAFPEAVIVKEVYTGTKFQGRKELDKILDKVQQGDMVIFDSVSRMSRNAGDGYMLYEELFRNECGNSVAFGNTKAECIANARRYCKENQ